MKENKTCLDCLNCKVSIKSTVNRRLCFCSESKKKTIYPEKYFLTKKLCDEFEYMGKKPSAVVVFPAVAITKRKPLLRPRLYG